MIRRLQTFSNHYTFEAYCQKIAETFSSQLNRQDMESWRAAARQASRGSEIYEAIIRELRGGMIGGIFASKIQENAKLIQSVPKAIASRFTDIVQEEALKGKRANEIAEILKGKYQGLSQSHLQMIARTEVSKTQTALTQARAQNLGLDWYVWRTSEDGRVRNSHRHMANTLVQWDTPPDPERIAGKKSYGRYHAGDTFNCRCYPEPVVSLDFLTWPMKVYYNGTIQKMTRRKFESITV